MPSEFPRSPRLLKGALIQFSAPMLIPIPNIIVFQYNPESLSRTITPWGPTTKEGQGTSKGPKEENPLVQPFDPNETFTLSLELDAADALEEPESHPIAVVSGIADRIAAMEMLLYPSGDSALGSLLGVSAGASLAGAPTGGGANILPCKTVPVVLFFWGPGRIVPVRLTSFSVDEQAFSPTLYPIRAKVTIGLQILDARAFDNQEQTAVVKIAKTCYTFTRAQKEVLAMANIANTVESILSMLPF